MVSDYSKKAIFISYLAATIISLTGFYVIASKGYRYHQNPETSQINHEKKEAQPSESIFKEMGKLEKVIQSYFQKK